MRLNLKVYFNFDTIANKWCQITHLSRKSKYCISSYSFHGNLSFWNLEIQRPKVTVHKCAQTIQGKKKIKGRNYTRKYSKLFTEKCGKLKLSPQGRDLALFVLLTKVEIPSEIKPSFANP